MFLFPLSTRYGIESLLMKYNVDVAFWAHEHNYERIYPIYDYTFDNQVTNILG